MNPLRRLLCTAALLTASGPDGRVIVLDPAAAVHPSDDGVGDDRRAGRTVPSSDVL